MKISDNELTMRCMNLLKEEFGPVDAERFVYVMTRDGFDYTEWQRNLFDGETVRSLGEKIKAFAAAKRQSGTS